MKELYHRTMCDVIKQYSMPLKPDTLAIRMDVSTSCYAIVIAHKSTGIESSTGDIMFGEPIDVKEEIYTMLLDLEQQITGMAIDLERKEEEKWEM